MKKLNSIQVKRIQCYLCMKGAGFKNCCECPFFTNLRQCNKRKKVFSKDVIEEIANAWENIKEQK